MCFRSREVLHELTYLSAKLEKSITDLGVLFSDLTLQISSNFANLQWRKLIFKTILPRYDSSNFPDFTILQL